MKKIMNNDLHNFYFITMYITNQFLRNKIKNHINYIT